MNSKNKKKPKKTTENFNHINNKNDGVIDETLPGNHRIVFLR